MMMMAGVGLLAAAVPVRAGQAKAQPLDPPPPPGASLGTYVFQDEFDGPAGAAPDPSKWVVVNWDEPVTPPILGKYRDRRENVFQDGNSNLVIRATREGPDYFTGRIEGIPRLGMGHTWEARIKLECLTPGCWPAFWLVNEDPLPDGEVDIVEWYGNNAWAPGSTVHAASTGRTWRGRDIPELVDDAWHTWRVNWADDGFRFWRDYVDGAEPYLHVPAVPIDGRWPFNQPGYWMMPILNIAVGGPGGGDPAAGVFPAQMLVDYVRIW